MMTVTLFEVVLSFSILFCSDSGGKCNFLMGVLKSFKTQEATYIKAHRTQAFKILYRKEFGFFTF